MDTKVRHVEATTETKSRTDRPAAARSALRVLVGVWSAFVVIGLLLMDILQDDASYGLAILVLGGTVAVASTAVPDFKASLPWVGRRVDRRDLVAVGILYVGVVGLLRLAFGVFTANHMLWFFLSFAAALLLGVGGPVLYQVGIRRGSLMDLGIGTLRWRSTVALGLLFAGIQFSITLWGYDLPHPVDWVPLTVLALAVGLFEAVFFRGFVQGRLESSLGVIPAVIGAAALYGVYHVGYGMGPSEMFFLFGLGIVYAVAYRLTENVLVLWPLLTPLGYVFAALEAGDMQGDLPWASIAGFGDVLGLMALILWIAHKHELKRRRLPAWTIREHVDTHRPSAPARV
jgi:membrane protease YdiL (CAAX protease family)